jgi:hypothetical protein
MAPHRRVSRLPTTDDEVLYRLTRLDSEGKQVQSHAQRRETAQTTTPADVRCWSTWYRRRPRPREWPSAAPTPSRPSSNYLGRRERREECWL